MRESLLLEDNPKVASYGIFNDNSTLNEFMKKNDENVGVRLAMRSRLIKRRKLLSDISAFLAFLGFSLAVIETELYADYVFGVAGKKHALSIVMKSFVSFSTVALVFFVLAYHHTDLKLFLVANCIEHWSLAMTPRRIVTLILEIFICSVHPIPGDYEWNTMPYRVPTDVILTLIMSLRIYLLARVLLYHSQLFQDTSAQSLGALNKINLNIFFIFKVMMNRYPEHVMITLIVVIFIWCSWAMRACEMYHETPMERSFLSSMWLVAITFLTIGYGDVTPVSYCGRTISVLTGIFGAGFTALTVATLARKLELTSAEKYVQQFVIDVEINKQIKNCAANILKESWFIFKYRRSPETLEKARLHQRRFMQCVRDMKSLKEESRIHKDSHISLQEIYRAQNVFQTTLEQMMIQIQKLNQQLEPLAASSFTSENA